MPLTAEQDGAHVYWSVPKTWFPGGVGLKKEDAVDLLHELWRLPRTTKRERLLARLLAGVHPPDGGAVAAASEAVLTPTIPEPEAEHSRVVEDSLVARRTLRMKYFSAHSSDLSARDVSVHRVVPGPPARFVALCHREGILKWFRVEGIVTCALDPSVPFREADPSHVNDYVSASADGFHGDDEVSDHVFFVNEPESRWVRRNLISPMCAEDVAGGIRVTATTAGALRIARFVVALGAGARAETETLRALVLELAQGAVRNAMETARPKRISETDVNSRAVGSIRAGK
jgi:hypothetical protein